VAKSNVYATDFISKANCQLIFSKDRLIAMDIGI